MQRGHNRAPCFIDDDDRTFFLQELSEHAAASRCAVHAYVLMTNHVHLLLTPDDETGPSRLMHNLGRRYMQAFNRAHHRSGTLWEGRYRSCIVDDESYVLACYRYIELNSVRAGLSARADAYAWSSHRINATSAPSRLVTPHPVHDALGADPRTRSERYLDLFAAPLRALTIETLRDATQSNGMLQAPRGQPGSELPLRPQE